MKGGETGTVELFVAVVDYDVSKGGKGCAAPFLGRLHSQKCGSLATFFCVR